MIIGISVCLNALSIIVLSYSVIQWSKRIKKLEDSK